MGAGISGVPMEDLLAKFDDLKKKIKEREAVFAALQEDKLVAYADFQKNKIKYLKTSAKLW